MEVTAPTYEMKTVTVDVESPLEEQGKFRIVLTQTFKEPGTKLKWLQAPPGTHFPEAFWQKTEVIPLRKGEPGHLQVQFLPLRVGRSFMRRRRR